jgi:hypothetical protein
MIKFINCLDQFFLYFAFREFFFLIGYTQILTNPVDWIKSGYETGFVISNRFLEMVVKSNPFYLLWIWILKKWSDNKRVVSGSILTSDKN